MDTRTPPATFADLLQRYRRAAGLTQEQLAERAHLSVRGISNLERGVRRLPQRATVALLIEVLGLEKAERAAFLAAARGLGEPTAADPPALAVPTNLPLALTSFIGRERELTTVRRLLGESRLLTLTGAGGCGKTRLALEVARALIRDAPQGATYADGIWLVELAALSDGERVAQAVATVLGVREQAGHAPLDRLTAFLCPKQLLLLLDNCEHMLGACAALADALLRRCPRLTVLATSREALGIGGERPWRVPSLGLPDPRGRLTLEQAAASEAVRLFVQRAQVARPDFALSGHQVVLAAQVCRRLDGIPLAIELAAARLSALSLDQLSMRLDDRFRLLTGGSRVALPRQQTLRATLDWSFDLLDQAERLLLRRLSVFAGGWTVEAAEAVCADEGTVTAAPPWRTGTAGGARGADGVARDGERIALLAPEEVLVLLTGLVDKSLVLLEEGAASARYRLLEMVRQYAREQLAAAGEASRLQDRHLDWYLALATQVAQHIGGAEREVWLDRLEVDLENFRTALRWSSLEGRQQAGLRLATALEDFWYIRGYAGEGRGWLEGLLERGGATMPVTLRARAMEVLALLTRYQGEHATAMQLFEAAHTLHSSEGNLASATWALNHQGLVAISLGEYQRATALLERVLPAFRDQGDLHGVGWALCFLGWIRLLRGEYAQAAALHDESLAVFQELGDKLGIGQALGFLGHDAREQGDYGRARRLYRESLGARRALLDKVGVAYSFEGMAALAAAEGQPLRAARLLGAAHCLREVIGTPVEQIDRAAYDRMVAEVHTALGEEAFEATWATGRAMSLEEAIVDALEDDPCR
jgi:non-specific serine/threonine protein kinase